MKRLNTRENFINVLVDCQGHDEATAIETAKEYRNNLEDYITDCGGDDEAIKECKEFCGVR